VLKYPTGYLPFCISCQKQLKIVIVYFCTMNPQ
jgi:hypothetical protein